MQSPVVKEKKKKSKERQPAQEKKIGYGYFCPLSDLFSPFSFFLFWRENFLVGLEKKHLNPTIYFSFFLPNQTHSKFYGNMCDEKNA